MVIATAASCMKLLALTKTLCCQSAGAGLFQALKTGAGVTLKPALFVYFSRCTKLQEYSETPERRLVGDIRSMDGEGFCDSLLG